MIFGQSAGAISVCYHLAAPASSSLFRAALMESGFCTGLTLQEGESRSVNVTTTIGCTQQNYQEQLECLRNTSTLDVFHAGDLEWYFP